MPLGDHPSDVRLYSHDGPDLLGELPPDQVAPAASLEPDDVTTQVLELVGQDSRPDQGLEAHVAWK